MRRREFLGGLTGVASWPVVARGQQAALPSIGYLGATTAAGEKTRIDALRQRLRELGWIEGQTITIHYRWGEGRTDLFRALAAELVGLQVNVVLTASTAGALACKEATNTIPIVFPLTGDPIGTGLVASLARPGGNVTGLTNQASDLAGKRLEILREVLPGFTRLAILTNAGYPGRISEIADVQAAALVLGVDVAICEMREPEDVATLIQRAVQTRPQALYVLGDTVLNSNRFQIAKLAISTRLPTMFGSQESVEAGGLMSYGANVPQLFRRAAELVDKIVRGAKPSDIPVEQPTKFDLVINLNTANALGLTVPPTLLARADEVIE